MLSFPTRLVLIRLRNFATTLTSFLDERRLRLLAIYFAGFFSHALLSHFFLASSVDIDDDESAASPPWRFHRHSSAALPPPFVPKTRYEVLRYDALDGKWMYNNVDDDPRIGLTRHHKADVADIAQQAVARLNEKEDEEEETDLGEKGVVMEEKEASRRSNFRKQKQKNIALKKKKFRFKLKSYVRGWRRFDPTRGEEHQLLLDVTLSDGRRSSTDRRLLVNIVKPLAEARLVGAQDVRRDSQPLVHFIVPVARLSSRFDDFIRNYEEVCLKGGNGNRESSKGKSGDSQKNSLDLGCALILVVFDGPSHLDKDTVANVEAHLARLTRIYGDALTRARLIRTKDAFTRALGMDLAARQLPSDALVFFVDVDVTFNADFVENCRLLTERGKNVYYPIVFSQYDPAIVGNYSYIGGGRTGKSSAKGTASPSSSSVKKPPPDMTIISKLTGHWVVYGFGMACLYKADYDAVGGFDLTIRGWGGEDVALFDSHVRHPSITVTRACEPGLVHRYHERYCDPDLGEDQLRMCRGAAAESLGSRAQLANLVAETRKDGQKGVFQRP